MRIHITVFIIFFKATKAKKQQVPGRGNEVEGNELASEEWMLPGARPLVSHLPAIKQKHINQSYVHE